MSHFTKQDFSTQYYFNLKYQNHEHSRSNEHKKKAHPNISNHHHYCCNSDVFHQQIKHTLKKMQAEKKGRKPISDKKKPVTIYVRESEIKKVGGSVKLKDNLLTYISKIKN